MASKEMTKNENWMIFWGAKNHGSWQEMGHFEKFVGASTSMGKKGHRFASAMQGDDFGDEK